jgi:hypothetical protein
VGFLDTLKNIFAPPAKEGQPLWVPASSPNTERSMKYFKDTFRIGMVAMFTTQEEHDAIQKYKKELDNLGYETEVLLFINDKEVPRNCFLPNFTLKDFTKEGIPYNPRVDRFVKKKFDMLFNLYFTDILPLQYVSGQSVAKCRIGAYRPALKEVTDLFVYTEPTDDILLLIEKINHTLEKQAYERKLL